MFLFIDFLLIIIFLYSYLYVHSKMVPRYNKYNKLFIKIYKKKKISKHLVN